MEGTVTSLETKQYPYQGKTKDSLIINMVDSDNLKMVVQIGLGSSTASSILNTLAGEAILGVIKMETGKPREYQGKMYPTFYMKNNGEKTDWKYSKDKGNWNEIPKVETIRDDDGNDIKKGVKANTEFWKKVVVDINAKLSGATPTTSTPHTGSPKPNPSSTTKEQPPLNTNFSESEIDSDLPF